MRTTRWMLGVLASVALFNCMGAAGKDGKDGKDGVPGLSAPVPTSSIAWVSQKELLVGRTTTLTVLGAGTRFDATTTLNLGAGIEVLKTQLLSEVTVEATVKVANDAALGDRTLTVTTGSVSLTSAIPLKVIASTKGTLEDGKFAQGAEGALRIDVSAPSYFAPISSSGNLVVANATFTTTGKLLLSQGALWMSNQSALLGFAASPFATKEAIEIEYTDKTKETVVVEFAPTASQALVEGTPSELKLSNVDTFKILSFTSEANRALTVSLKLPTSSTLKPVMRAYTESQAAPVADVTGLTLAIPASATATTYKIVVSDSSDKLTATEATLEASVKVSELATNATCASGECTIKWTFSPALDIPTTPEASILLPFTVGGAEACTIEKATANWELTHTYPRDVKFRFIFPDGTKTTNTQAFSPSQGATSAGVKTTGTATKDTAPWAGISANGMWTLDIQDVYEEDTGVLGSFELKITCAPNN